MESSSEKLEGSSGNLERRRIARKTTETSGAQFEGSFAAGTRQDQWNVPKEPGTWNAIYHYLTYGWNSKAIWKSAKFIEFFGTAFQIYITAMMSVTVINFQSPYLPEYVGVVNGIFIGLFIYATAPSSGGHLNPMITFATLLAGLIEFSRAVLYILAQASGALLAGGLIRGSLGSNITDKYHGGGCFLNSTTGSVSIGQAFLLETVFALVTIFLAFGVGLDPRQAQLFGPTLGPAMVGITLGVMIFSSAGLGFAGYSGPSFNPGRCLAFSVARLDFENQWIFWVGPATAGVVHGVIYYMVPPVKLIRISGEGIP
ncbi:aquaporin-like protein [Lipomyces starkeyi]